MNHNAPIFKGLELHTCAFKHRYARESTKTNIYGFLSGRRGYAYMVPKYVSFVVFPVVVVCVCSRSTNPIYLEIGARNT